jgi:hypothetical protein
MKRLLLSLLPLVAALLCAGSLASAVSADGEWCETDPVVLVRTPAGNQAMVHVTLYGLGTEHQAALRAATISYTTQSVSGQAATDVEIQVVVPDDQSAAGFSVRSVASTLPYASGTVLASDAGKSGLAMKLRFRLDQP